MTADFDAVIEASFGALGVHTEGDAITGISFLPPGTKPLAPTNALAARARDQLSAYLSNPETRFDLPLKPAGTAFQREVWKAIAAVSVGRTQRYGEIAKKLKSAPRAVGQACGRNPYPVIVPCHRVVGAGGLGGFAQARDGFLLEAKRWLLTHEGAL
ncbi:MAG: methylated-DNA--[protein]-cysteine S-methyltransferase [Rhodocyclaceae bacterium]|nr:methylated-DNA--[protein]-cysteine S-methyltransferase [Rhodocyclaceae bacterium]